MSYVLSDGGFIVPPEFEPFINHDRIEVPRFVASLDWKTGEHRLEPVEVYEKRIDGERAVHFVAWDGCVLRTTTMDRYRELCDEVTS